MFEHHSTSPTLIDLLHQRAFENQNRILYTFLRDGEIDEVHLTYQALETQARALGTVLHSQNVARERALILCPSGLKFITAFFGALYGGMIAVPAYPPRLNRPDSRLEGIILDAQPSIVLATSEMMANRERYFRHTPALRKVRWLAVDDVDDGKSAQWEPPNITDDSVAFLQYTSGSTGNPKGVIVTHKNILANERLIQQNFGHTQQSKGVGWLPLFHDMGLIGDILQPLYAGSHIVLMSPAAFLQKPLRWLDAISRYRATSSVAPNFAYDLCVQNIPDDEAQKLDLSTWQTAINGAEPIQAQTMERFTTKFAPCGFHWEAFCPTYGLAEATLLLTSSVNTVPPTQVEIQKKALEQGQAVIAAPGNPDTQTIVGSGQAGIGSEVVVVDPETHLLCPEGQVGEIWAAGDHITSGYWQKPAETDHTFYAYLANNNEGPFLRTGDLGFLQAGELFVTGRTKDLIIIRGRNHYPQDIEYTGSQCHKSLEPMRGAAFTVNVGSEARLVIVQEVKRTHLRKINDETYRDIAAAIRLAIANEYDLRLDTVALIRSGSLPRTSSGKVQRRACREAYLNQRLKLIFTPDEQAENAAKVPEPGQQASSNSAKLPLVHQELADLSVDKQDERLTEYLYTHITQLLGQPTGSKLGTMPIVPQLQLGAFGADSLFLIEFKNKLETTFDIRLPVSSFTADRSLAELAAEIRTQLYPASDPAQISTLDGSLNQRAVDPTVEQKVAPISNGQSKADDTIAITPTQHRFFENNFVDPHHWNIGVLLEVDNGLDVRLLEQAFHHLLRHHDALRIRFVQERHVREETIWRQWFTAPEASTPFTQIDLSMVSASEQSAKVEEIAAERQTTLDFVNGPIMHCIHFDLGPQQPGRLFVLLHHMMTDMFGLRIVLQDLEQACLQLSRGEAIQLPQTTSYIEWVQRLTDYAQSEACGQSYPYWHSISPSQIDSLPIDFPEGENSEESAYQMTLVWSPEESQQILQIATQAHDVHITDILVTAIMQAYTDWSGSESFWFETGHHRRTEFLEGVDLTHTVCPANSFYPVLLKRDRRLNLIDLLQDVKEQMGAVPNLGYDYVFLRHTREEASTRAYINSLPEVEMMFIYYGHMFDDASSALFRQARESIGPRYGLKNHLKRPLSLWAFVREQQIYVEMRYSQNLFDQAKMDRLLQLIKESLSTFIGD